MVIIIAPERYFTKILPCEFVNQCSGFRINHFDLIKNNVKFAFFRFPMDEVVLFDDA